MFKVENHRSRNAARAAQVIIAAALTAAPAVAADKSFLVASGVWGTAGNWNPVGAPGAADNAFIGNSAAATNGTVSLGGNASALNLVINDGMTLRTQLFTPTIGSHTAITGFNDPAGPDMFRSRLWVDNGNNAIDFQTNTLTADDGATVTMGNGATMRVNGLFDLNLGTTFTGSGTIDLFSNAVGPAMLVNGQITPNSGGNISIEQHGTGRVDLDGTLEGDQTINVTGTTGFTHSSFRIVGAGLQDAFGDRMLIGRGNLANMLLSEGWTLSQAGEIEFQHDAARTELAAIHGGTMTVQGDIRVNADGGGIIQSYAIMQPGSLASVGANASLTFNQGATINGGEFNVANGGELDFTAPITVSGGTFNAAGTTGQVIFTGFTTYEGGAHFGGWTRQIGTATVSTATTITADTFDMDGVGLTQWHINAPLTLDATELSFGGNNIFNGTLNINSPNAFSPNYLDMSLSSAWRLQGTMNLVGPGGGVVHANTLRGSDLHMAGVINATGGHAISSRIEVESGGTMNINAGGSVRLDGGTIATPNRIDGGRILGSGTLRSLADHALVGSGTIATTIDFDGNSELRARDGILNIAGQIADVGVIGTANDAGFLNVINPWNTAVADSVQLLGGRIQGAAITNDGHITGRGLVNPLSIVNNGSITASGGELVVNTIADSIDLDGGFAATGRVNAVAGNVTIDDELTDAFNGHAFIGASRTLKLNEGWVVSAPAIVELSGAPGNPATLAGNGGNGQGAYGAMFVINGPAQFDMPSYFGTGTQVQTTAAGDSLTLMRGDYIDSGVTFSGPGELRNANTGSLVLGEGANVGIRLVNSGPMGIDLSNQTGIASIQAFQQTAPGMTRVELSGAVPGTSFDRINVAEDAQLAGSLELGVLAGYDPAYLQNHEILRADSVTGYFQTVPGNMISATKYWAVTYDADSVNVTAALPGDANLDGSVNLDDFTTLAASFGQPGPWVTGNFNGDLRVTLDDFTALAANFGTSVAASLPRGTAVPEPRSIGLILMAVAGLSRRRRK